MYRKQFISLMSNRLEAIASSAIGGYLVRDGSVELNVSITAE